MTDETIRLLQAGDSYAALQRIQRQGLPREVATRFDALVRDLYWKAKDLPAVVEVARGGIQYCLTKVDEAADSADRSFFGDHAKKLAFNLASFTWPGWDESGISPSSGDLAVGLDAAKLNLRLARELSKPANRVEDAHWLLGAHLLAGGSATLALSEFHQCSPQTRPLYAGYELLAQIIMGDTQAGKQFDELLASMRAKPDNDEKEHAEQLAIAYRVFAEH